MIIHERKDIGSNKLIRCPLLLLRLLNSEIENCEAPIFRAFFFLVHTIAAVPLPR